MQGALRWAALAALAPVRAVAALLAARTQRRDQVARQETERGAVESAEVLVLGAQVALTVVPEVVARAEQQAQREQVAKRAIALRVRSCVMISRAILLLLN
jgi:hypothetical protein